MTVKQIVAFRTSILTVMFTAVLILIYAYQSAWSMVLAIVFLLAWFFLHRILVRKAMRRLQYTVEVLRDVDLLEQECIQMKRLLDHTNNTTIYMLDSWVFECRGMFMEAAQAYESVVPRSGQKFRDNFYVNLFYHYCRAGMVEKAAPLLNHACRIEQESRGRDGNENYLTISVCIIWNPKIMNKPENTCPMHWIIAGQISRCCTCIMIWGGWRKLSRR